MRTLVKSKKGGIKARSKTSVRLMKKRLERTRRKKRSQPLNQDSADVERERKIAEREMEEKEEVSGSDNADTGSDEEEEAAAEAHSQLLSTITDLGRRRKRDQRSEATATVSQYQLPRQAGGEEVSIGGLLGGLVEEGRGVGSLRRKLATASSHQLVPPATKQQVEKAHRNLSYSSACKEVGKWLPIITHNRRTAHLSFPLQEETVLPPSLTSRAEDFQSVNHLEHAVRSVLDKSEGVIEAPDEELTAAERAELVRVMEEEGRERMRESRKWRMLMSQYEAKCQRERRIKSRRFHKVQRKRREKICARGEDGEEGEEEKAERLRATERMTLRHGRQSKWAREVLARKKKDPALRSALSEHSMRGRVLTQHPTLESDEESDSGVEERAGNSPQSTSLTSHHGNPWMDMSAPVLLLNSELRQEKGVAEVTEIREEEQEVNIDPSKQLLEQGSGGSADESTSGHESSCDVISLPTKRMTSSNPSNAGLQPVASSVGENESSNVISSQIDPTAYINTQKVGGALGVANQQLLSVHEAFSGDDVVSDFAREKQAAEAAGQEDTNLTLPGWGTWGGEGTRPAKKLQTEVKPDKKHRSDRELDHVIISDHGNMKINKHLVKKLPWPFSTSQQFHRANATPLGRHWNAEVVHRQLVTPHVKTAVGVAIPPVRLTDDVQDFMRRHSADTRGRIRRSQNRTRTHETHDKHTH